MWRQGAETLYLPGVLQRYFAELVLPVPQAALVFLQGFLMFFETVAHLNLHATTLVQFCCCGVELCL